MTSSTLLSDALVQHLPALRAFVRSRMGPSLSQREASVDVVQSVCRELLVAADGSAKFADEAAVRAWLHTAARNKILEKVRLHQAQRRNGNREEAWGEGAYEPGNDLTPSRDASAREQVDRFEAAFARLSHGEREIITLTRFAGLSHREVAERTGCSEESSRTRLRRALIHLSAFMSDRHE